MTPVIGAAAAVGAEPVNDPGRAGAPGASGLEGSGARRLSAPAAPRVELLRWFADPHDLAVGAARTCYAKGLVRPEEVSKTERARARRDAIARSTYQAGHHTTIQHPTFVFAIEGVSRQLIWSFLHAHPFYNSEQVSQRYVPVERGRYHVPALDDDALALYLACAEAQAEAYRELCALVRPEVERRFYAIYPARRRTPEAWQGAIEKRVLEVARYVLPVATHAHLYHTISGVTLFRYHKLAGMFDVPDEQRALVAAMVEAVRARDPSFLATLEDPVPLAETPEHALLVELYGRADGIGRAREFVERFDRELGGRRARLVDWKARAEETLARAVRSVFGATEEALPDDRALERALDPALDTHLGSALNVTTHSKLARALHHPHYTFQKKLSHTADSQAQRHRMTPGSRPILAAHYQPGRPDAIVPAIIDAVPSARARFDQAMEDTWRAIDRLLERGVRAEDALYLLPNAFPIRFEESGDLLNLRHRFTMRLCYLAQEEIFEVSRDEVAAIAAVHPRIARHLLAPCGQRKRAGVKPFCPEGARFCGSPVWDLAVADYDRLL